jgi:hypothetical protein
MILKDYLSKERGKIIREDVQRLINQICETFGKPNIHPANEVYNVSRLILFIDDAWKDRMRHKNVVGRPNEHIGVIQKCNNYHFERDFIRKEFTFIINHKRGKFNRMNYCLKTYRELCYMQTAMHIYKYGQDLSAEELSIVAINVLRRYFKIYEKVPFNFQSRCDYLWCIKNGVDLYTIIKEILDCPCEFFNTYLSRIDANFKIEYDERESINNPLESDEIKKMLSDGFPREMIVDRLMELLNCSRATAYRRLKESGLTRSYSTKHKQDIQIQRTE